MNKVILLAFLFSLDIFAQVDPNSAVRGAGSSPSGGCHACRTDSDHEIGNIALPVTRPRSGSLPYFNPKCQSFIQANGSYGTWGNYIVEYINSKGGENSRFLSDALPGMESAPQTCPNWRSLTGAAKMKFWVWMMASISQVESSCNPNAVNSGRVPNAADRPRGLFQLNTLNTRQSPRGWRGDNCGFPSGAQATFSPRNNTRCAIGIMDELLKGRSGEYRSSGKIFPTNSYWEKLRPNHSSNGGPIGRLARRYPPCGATP